MQTRSLSAQAPLTSGRVRPRPLPPGGTIAVVSPASPVVDREPLAEAQGWLEERGYAVRFSAHFNRRLGYTAGTPEERAFDLEAAFADPDVDAVLCLAGGHGAAQLLRHLDYDLIAETPKPFVGFSDITVLHAAIGRESGLVTFWGPMFAQLGTAGDATREGMVGALTKTGPLGPVAPSEPSARTLVDGIAEGELVGGTLSLLSSLLGTPWELDTAGKVLLIEDVGEEPCRVDRFLTHLLNAGKLDRCAGICLAEFMNCTQRTVCTRWAGESLTLDEVFAQVIEPLGIPAIYGHPLGHGPRLVTVPLGVRARLDAGKGRLSFVEGALEEV
jgi:muramoyltetrapeptide carboxypeptidase